jgi:cytosine deaminase
VTLNGAAAMGLPDPRLREGGAANLVILQARDPIEAVRLRTARLLVMRGGRVLARGAPRRSTLDLPGRPTSVDPAAYAPIDASATPH